MTENLMQYREQAANALYPFLASGANWDESRGKAMAYEAIDGYAPKTPREIQLSAQIVACSFAAISCLRPAIAGAKLSPEAILDLMDAALALDDEAHRSTVALEARQRERQRAPHVVKQAKMAWDHAAFNRTMSTALKHMRAADAKIADLLPRPKPVAPKLKVVSSAPMTTPVLASLAEHRTAEQAQGGPGQARSLSPSKPRSAAKGFKPRIVN